MNLFLNDTKTQVCTVILIELIREMKLAISALSEAEVLKLRKIAEVQNESKRLQKELKKLSKPILSPVKPMTFEDYDRVSRSIDKW